MVGGIGTGRDIRWRELHSWRLGLALGIGYRYGQDGELERTLRGIEYRLVDDMLLDTRIHSVIEAVAMYQHSNQTHNYIKAFTLIPFVPGC
jgi:hypothetical protein